MKLKLAYLTNRGKLRPRNEDALLVGDRVVSGISMERPELLDIDTDKILLAVADGMGGMPCGDKAGRLVLEYIKDCWVGSEKELENLLKRAAAFLDSYVSGHPECYGMGAALAGIFLKEGRAILFNVGDCRVYRFRDGLELLTKDHTEAYELYERGIIDEEELRHHPFRNTLTSAVMGGYPIDLKIYAMEIDVEEEDTFLICSDGLWDELSSADMEECTSLGMHEGAVRMFEKAYEGGRDNISLIFFKVL